MGGCRRPAAKPQMKRPAALGKAQSKWPAGSRGPQAKPPAASSKSETKTTAVTTKRGATQEAAPEEAAPAPCTPPTRRRLSFSPVASPVGQGSLPARREASPGGSPQTPSLEARRLAPLGCVNEWDSWSDRRKLAELTAHADAHHMPAPWLLSSDERRQLGWN